jgi:mannosyltransferase OCH1-like enzyme
MIPKILHQVFLVFDTPNIIDIPIYSKCLKKPKNVSRRMKNGNINYGLINNVKILLNYYPEFIQLWNDFTQPIMKADFIRYLILYHEGGIYLDLDIYPIKNFDSLFNKSEIFTTWHDDTRKLPYMHYWEVVKITYFLWK